MVGHHRVGHVSYPKMVAASICIVSIYCIISYVGACMHAYINKYVLQYITLSYIIILYKR